MTEPLRLVRASAETDPAEAGAVMSFERFFENEKANLYHALCLVTRNRHEAEELTQDAFVRVLERWDRVGTMENPTGYLYRTAMNAFRKAHRRAALAAKRVLAITPPDDAIAAVDERDATVRALAPLSSQQRAAIVLVDLIGFPSEEAARMLGVRAATVRKHTSRGRAALRKIMSEEP